MSTPFSQSRAWVEIDLPAIDRNVGRIKQALPRHVRYVAVVKADAYGHGMPEVARRLLQAGVDAFAVANVAEAIRLREVGHEGDTLLLSPTLPDEVARAAENGFDLTINSLEEVKAFAAWGSSHGRKVRVHVKVDTGMHRVGVAPRETLSLIRFMQSFDSVLLEGVYTHFAVADSPEHPANIEQLRLFNEVLTELAAHSIEPPLVHAANSAAALANPDSRFSMVRLGIAMYGLLPGDGVKELCRGLIPALALKSRVSAVRWIEAGEAVSYGLRRPVNAATLIATVPLGYADGVPRALGETTVGVLLNGVPRQFAGTITMDQLMIDCGTDSSVMVGDEVVLIGRQGEHVVTADEWANATGTIGYEIVCGISSRIGRRYQ